MIGEVGHLHRHRIKMEIGLQEAAFFLMNGGTLSSAEGGVIYPSKPMIKHGFKLKYNLVDTRGTYLNLVRLFIDEEDFNYYLLQGGYKSPEAITYIPGMQTTREFVDLHRKPLNPLQPVLRHGKNALPADLLEILYFSGFRFKEHDGLKGITIWPIFRSEENTWLGYTFPETIKQLPESLQDSLFHKESKIDRDLLISYHNTHKRSYEQFL